MVVVNRIVDLGGVWRVVDEVVGLVVDLISALVVV